ncbi:MAG: tetratricopeptide repeat protein, partial [Bacteroidales bacterium]|nr:tetratricopeptide repeat protein [Bacteroidales bacterium]
MDDIIEKLIEYKNKYDASSFEKKVEINLETDRLNNLGCDCYKIGNVPAAINFYNQALQVKPINDDALLNLTICYTKQGRYLQAIEQFRKLYYLYPNSTNKEKAIAYSLLWHLIDDYDGDTGAVSPSILIRFIENNFHFQTTDEEIKIVIRKLNTPYNRDIIVWFVFTLGWFGSRESPYMTSDGTDLSILEKEIQ